MPWKVKKSGNKFQVTEKGTGKVVATHSSSTDAEKQVKAMYANYNKKPKKRPRLGY
jgi:hypothetical protein